MEAGAVATAIAVMGIITLFGAGLSRWTTITPEAKHLMIQIVLHIAVPSVILNGVFNTSFSDELLSEIGLIIIASLIFHGCALLGALLLARAAGFTTTRGKQLTILAALGNTGFIGIPLAAAVFGPVGGLLAAIFDAGLDFFIFTVVLYMLQPGRGFHLRQLKTLVNAPLIAVIVGLTSAGLNLEPPVVLRQLVELLAGLAAPLAMLYIGILLQQLFARTGFTVYKELWFPLSVKLLLIPGIMLAVLPFTPLAVSTQHLLLLLSGMPTFMLAAILFSRYTEDEDTAVLTIAFSTVLSLATIPLLAWAGAVYLG
ncbi:AEC family transporter [Alkalicoccus urumqiensis]|uniref:Auxin efflux carrier n=1 Tax=Alkalicoccus urumqiensis TaxID=1548213 RepID=A0A2P6ML69_ALKUR|nr:AEC family transporter [Alkalicoccus urumqiensis]PRO67021.1 auxin efflux carrier [Alkalicoccus urumqiensis]